ncbi:hypothetical protein ACHAPO_007858 [Fusarium lateritium]
MPSSIKSIFSLKKDTAPKSEEEEPVVKSYTMDDYKKENENLKCEIKILQEQLTRRFQNARDVEHDVLEHRVLLDKTLRVLQSLDQQLGAIYDRKGIEKAIVKAANEPKLIYYKAEAFKKVKNAEYEIVGTQEIIRICIDRLKGHRKKFVKH